MPSWILARNIFNRHTVGFLVHGRHVQDFGIRQDGRGGEMGLGFLALEKTAAGRAQEIQFYISTRTEKYSCTHLQEQRNTVLQLYQDPGKQCIKNPIY